MCIQLLESICDQIYLSCLHQLTNKQFCGLQNNERTIRLRQSNKRAMRFALCW